MKIHIATAAYADLERLERWLVDRDATAAAKLAPVLLEAISSLRTFPARGAKAPSSNIRQLVRRFGGGAYVIRFEAGPDRVKITRIFHAREKR